jgi:glycosyltransferase involved in cell wall biosynthesis
MVADALWPVLGPTDPGILPALGSVCFVFPELVEGGAIRVLSVVTRRLREQGTAVEVVTVREGLDDSVIAVTNGLNPISGLPLHGSLRRHGAHLAATLYQAARRADVVISASEAGESLQLAYLAARAARKPFAVMLHSDPRWTFPRIMRRDQLAARFVYPHADAIIAVSRGLVDPIINYGVHPDRVVVIENGLDLDALRQETNHPAPYLPNRPFAVSAGRLVDLKGFDLLIRAHAQARHHGWDRDLLILGDGPEAHNLAALAANLNVTDSVHLPGAVPTVAPYLAAADLAIVGSRTEALSMFLIQAIALAVPAIATDCPVGPRDVLENGLLGDLVPVDDLNALTTALLNHQTNPTRLQHKVHHRNPTNQRFSLTTCAQGHLNLYTNLAHHQPPQQPAPRPVISAIGAAAEARRRWPAR